MPARVQRVPNHKERVSAVVVLFASRAEVDVAANEALQDATRGALCQDLAGAYYLCHGDSHTHPEPFSLDWTLPATVADDMRVFLSVSNWPK